jgi:hypothetical protein
MSNLGRAMAGPEPTPAERAEWLASAERILKAYSHLESVTVHTDDYEVKYDPKSANWGT